MQKTENFSQRDNHAGRSLLAVATALALAPLACLAETSANAVAANPQAPSSVEQGALSPAAQDCSRYDKYNSRISLTQFSPPACDTVSPTLFGLRPWLADHGLGITFQTVAIGQYDVLHHNARPQQYAGQNFNFFDVNTLQLTYDLSRIGFTDGAQLTVGVGASASEDRNTGTAPRYTTMTTFAVDQPLFGSSVELLYGYLQVSENFYGMQLGGNAASQVLGPSSSIPVETGLSIFTPTPTAEIVVRDPWTKAFYNNFAVTRSVSPQGIVEDIKENSTGFSLHVPGANALYVDEFGYKTPPGSGQRDIWARAGAIYNTSDYSKFTGGTSSNNYGLYAALTYQLTNVGRGPGGLNLDIKVDYAPSDRNLFARDYSVTLYDVGPFASRPLDMVALGFSQTFYSHELRSLVAQTGVDTSPVSTALSLSYAYHLIHGVYVISSLAATTNPATGASKKLPTALVVNEKLVLSF